MQKLLLTASTTDVVTVIISAALELDSSDIHIEAEEAGIKFRLRVDGFLQDAATLPPEAWKKIISRIKLIAGLKLNITDRPQDGRFTIFLKSEKNRRPHLHLTDCLRRIRGPAFAPLWSHQDRFGSVRLASACF